MSQKKLFIWLTTFSSLCGPMVISEKKHKKGVIHGKNHKGLPRSDWLPVVPVDFAAAVLAGFSRFRLGFKANAGRAPVAITAPYTSKMAAIASLNAVAPVSTPHGSYSSIGAPVRAVVPRAPRVFRTPIWKRVLNGTDGAVSQNVGGRVFDAPDARPSCRLVASRGDERRISSRRMTLHTLSETRAPLADPNIRSLRARRDVFGPRVIRLIADFAPLSRAPSSPQAKLSSKMSTGIKAQAKVAAKVRTRHVHGSPFEPARDSIGRRARETHAPAPRW